MKLLFVQGILYFTWILSGKLPVYKWSRVSIRTERGTSPWSSVSDRRSGANQSRSGYGNMVDWCDKLCRTLFQKVNSIRLRNMSCTVLVNFQSVKWPAVWTKYVSGLSGSEGQWPSVVVVIPQPWCTVGEWRDGCDGRIRSDHTSRDCSHKARQHHQFHHLISGLCCYLSLWQLMHVHIRNSFLYLHVKIEKINWEASPENIWVTMKILLLFNKFCILTVIILLFLCRYIKYRM